MMIRCEVPPNAVSTTTDLSLFGGRIPTQVGPMRLYRHHLFKLEVLLPVIPTRYVLIAFPFGTADTGMTEAGRATVEKYLVELQDTTSVSVTVTVLYVSPDIDVAFAILDTGSNFNTLDIFASCDTYRRQGGVTDLHGKRRVLSFPTDIAAIDAATLKKDFYGIPACTLCGDRLERSISGYTTTVCNCPQEKFCDCLGLSRCVTCRDIFAALTSKDGPSNVCGECGAGDDPWLCLLCGYVGCSWYQGKHASKHFDETGHVFSLSLITQQIWDYVSDRFVHRMIIALDAQTGQSHRMQFVDRGLQNPLIQVAGEDGDANSDDRDPKCGVKKFTDSKNDVRIEQTSMDFVRLIKAQLDSQREMFEQERARVSSDAAHGRGKGTAVPSGGSVGHSRGQSPALTGSDAGRSLDFPLPLHPLHRDPWSRATSAEPPEPAAATGQRSHGDGDGDIYAALASIDQELVAPRKLRKEWISTFNYTRNLSQELRQRVSEEVVLKARLEALKQRYSSLIQSEVAEESELDRSIDDLKDTIKEVTANLSVQQRLQQRLRGEGEAVRLAVLGSGNANPTPSSSSPPRPSKSRPNK